MTVQTTQSSRTLAGNGVAVDFPMAFPFLANAYITVKLAGVVQTLNTHYTLAGAGIIDAFGVRTNGTVTFLAAPANGAVVYIERNTTILQETALRSSGDFLPATHEEMFDRLTMIAQENRRDIEVLEALGASLATPTSASIIFVDHTFLTDPDAIEEGFPLNVAATGGSGATGAWCVRLRNLDDPTEVFDEPPSIQWAPSAGSFISLQRVSGLRPNTNYTIRLAVVTP